MKLFTKICGAALLLCGAMLAQLPVDRISVRFATPVLIGETKFPAGDCDIQVVRGSSDQVVLVMRSHDGPSASALVNFISDDTTDTTDGHASLILERRGDTYRLNRIVLPDHTGYQLVHAE
jgi:hypothetical protein